MQQLHNISGLIDPWRYNSGHLRKHQKARSGKSTAFIRVCEAYHSLQAVDWY